MQLGENRLDGHRAVRLHCAVSPQSFDDSESLGERFRRLELRSHDQGSGPVDVTPLAVDLYRIQAGSSLRHLGPVLDLRYGGIRRRLVVLENFGLDLRSMARRRKGQEEKKR